MHSCKVAVRCVAFEDPGQISVIKILRLNVDVHVGKIRIDAASDIHCDSVDDVPVQSLRILGYCDCMHIRDEEQCLIVFLIVYDLRDSARIISDRK